VSELTASAYDSIYDTKLTVTDISECAKRLDSEAFWDQDVRQQSNALSMIVTSTSTSAALGGDCATEETTKEWEAPKPFSIDMVDFHSGVSAKDVDILEYNGRTLALIASTYKNNENTFWLYDVTDTDDIKLIGGFMAEATYNAVDGYINDNGILYAFLASASQTTQFQVLKSNLSTYPVNATTTISRISASSMPGVTAGATSIYYLNDRIYIGTEQKSGPLANDFVVFKDVLNETPLMPTAMSGVNLNHTVNDIVVRGNYAYIAASASTANGCELIVLNVEEPLNMVNTCTPGSMSGNMNFRAPGNFDGTAVTTHGNKVYLGRASSNNPELYVLDITSPTNITSLGNLNINYNSNRKIVGLRVTGNLIFIASDDLNPQSGGGIFLVYSIKNPTNITPVSLCNVNTSEKATSIDYLNDRVYITQDSGEPMQIFYSDLSCS
jgi:hypothetical protein